MKKLLDLIGTLGIVAENKYEKPQKKDEKEYLFEILEKEECFIKKRMC